MLRHLLSMLLGPLSLLLTLTLTSNAFGQTTPPFPVEVAYILTSQGIQVYDVDRQTGIPAFEGLATAPLRFISVVPSADDHFVYVHGSNAIYGRGTLYVYRTDSTGMLRQPASQELNLPNSPHSSQFIPTENSHTQSFPGLTPTKKLTPGYYSSLSIR